MLMEIWNDESGQGMVEYGLILALVSVVAIGALSGIGDKVNAHFGTVSDKLGETPTP